MNGKSGKSIETKVEKGDEVITLEKDDERYKVMFKKRLINKRVKKIETSDTNHE